MLVGTLDFCPNRLERNWMCQSEKVQLRFYCPDINTVTSGHVNDEVQYYKPENAVQEQDGGEIVITAEKRPDGKIYSAR